MKYTKILFICFLGLLACASPVRIKNTEAAPGFSLANYKTFNFYDVTSESDGSAAPNDDLYNRRIDILKQGIQQELAAKGLTLSPDNPDLLVNIGVFTREKVQTRETNFREDAPRYIGQRRYSWQSREVEVGRYREGTVTVHLVDRERNAMVWKGSAEAIIPKKEAQLQKTIQEGVGKLFAQL